MFKREERPDVDRIYMNFVGMPPASQSFRANIAQVQATTGSGFVSGPSERSN